MKKLFPLVALLTLIACQKETMQPSTLSTQVSNDAQVQRTRAEVPFEFFVFNDCTQEWILFTGIQEIDIRQTTNKNGVREGSQLQYKNTVGVGQTTGKVYKIIGQSNTSSNDTDDGFNFSVHTRITTATQGANNDLVTTFKVQVVSNADGLKVFRSDFAEFCK